MARRLMLNKGTRMILTTHARKFLGELELNPDENREVRAAQRRRDTVSAKLTAAAIAAAKAWVPDTDMDVLRRYGLTVKKDKLTFAVVDHPDKVFEIEMYDGAALERDFDSLQEDEREERRAQIAQAEAAAQIEVPQRGGEHTSWGFRPSSPRLVPCDMIVHTLHKDFELAKRDEKEAIKRLREKHWALLSSLETLIAGSKYYEDVCAAWPNALEVEDRIKPENTKVSVLSTDALADIARACEQHAKVTGRQLPSPAQKSLPAPGTGAVMVSCEVLEGEIIN